MKKKIILAILMMGSLAFLPGRALAVELGQDKICDGHIVDPAQKEAAGCDKTADAGEVGNVMQNVINIVIAVLGIVAVLFVIIGAAQYMVSQGDPAKAKKAKDTIIYAILGVVLATLAYAIVNFVLMNVFGGNTGTPETSSATEAQKTE